MGQKEKDFNELRVTPRRKVVRGRRGGMEDGNGPAKGGTYEKKRGEGRNQRWNAKKKILCLVALTNTRQKGREMSPKKSHAFPKLR